MISSVPTWARPAIDNFLTHQTMPNTARMDLPAEAAAEFFKTAADQFDGIRARDNSAQDLDPQQGSLRFHLEGTNVDSVVHYEGDSQVGVLTAALCPEGSGEPETIVFQRFTPTSQDTVIQSKAGEISGAHIEPGLGFLLSPA